MKILILASNPRQDLRLDREIRDLRDVIEKSRHRQQFEVADALAVRVGDLQDLLFQHRPEIVHFCGHGSGQQGLVFEGNGGGEQWVRTEALSDLFRLFSSHVGCVLLNACYSETQADAIVSHIDYVIGMNQTIQDDAAIAFSKGFYRALGYECSIEEAFEFGKNAIQLEITGSSKVRSAVPEPQRRLEVVDAVAKTIIPEHLKPILKKRSDLRAVQSVPSHQPLTQERREEIQLEVDRALGEEETSLEQFREQVKRYLQKRKLADYEKDLLETLREELGLSKAEADRVLEEEYAPIRQARQAYARRLRVLIKYYPFNDAIQRELKAFQTQRNLTDVEVNEISRPIIDQAEANRKARLRQQVARAAVRFAEHWTEANRRQARLRQQAQEKHDAKLQCYEQVFKKAIDSQYPIEAAIREGLWKLQQSLGLMDEEVDQIERPIVALKEAEYQRQLEQQREQQRQHELERQRELARQQQLEEQRKQEAAKRRPPIQVFEFQVPQIEIAEKFLGLERTGNITYRNGQAEFFSEDLGNGVTLEMVFIPGGTFMMGQTEGEKQQLIQEVGEKDYQNYYANELPQHQVTVPPVFIGRFVVTQEQWKAVAALPKINQDLDPDPSDFKGYRRPVEQVSWHEAVEFCDRLSQKTGRQYRLPSEAEWEYVCRAGTTTPFHCGETISTDLANYNGNSTYGLGVKGVYREQTTDVGSFPPNAFGLYDMHGNVWEWCLDQRHENYQGAPIDGSAWTRGNSKRRLVRGGAWFDAPMNSRSAFRFHLAPDYYSSKVSFRVACGLA
ncbi:SUMF1/EgtB/PvdO family nonheme iron enzyme [Egbenema bharatensis]|uniref:SUMF1/EgtB/PvdO family nonheme iron enzyme n=1 Tax=Egbenema bharatensis TaxID=3463334 RepID=UPI003A84265F